MGLSRKQETYLLILGAVAAVAVAVRMFWDDAVALMGGNDA